MKHALKILAFGLAIVVANAAQGRPIHGGVAVGAPPPPPGIVTSFTIKNSSGGSVSNQLVTLAIPLQKGDVPVGNKIQIDKNDGVTTIPTQQDRCSTWAQDGSLKVCSVSFIEPDTIAAGTSATYKVLSAIGSPNTTPNISTANITANTNIAVKTSNLTEAQGSAEAGTWDLISLNYVLGSCSQYSNSTGYGANPKCGWELVTAGPNRYGIHAFQYAKRESDSAFHDWIRTDIWVDFWGSASFPCPCSVAVQVSQPNTFGAVSGGTVGSSPQGGYVFSAQVLNGTNVIYNLGGSGDSRVLSLTSASFDAPSGNVTFPASSWDATTMGVFPVAFTSSGSMPTGLTSGVPYYIQTEGSNTDLYTNIYQLYPSQCSASQRDPCLAILFTAASSSNSPLVASGNYLSLTNNDGGFTVYYKLCPTSSCVAAITDTPITAHATAYAPVGSNTFIAYLTLDTGAPNTITLQYRQGFSTAGSGTITATPMVMTTPFSGFLGLDSTAQRFWINSSGTVGTPPPLLIGHEFVYLTQNSKAVPPYITALSGSLLAISTPAITYYPGSYFYPWDMNATGDGPGDVRIGYIDHDGAYSLFMPNDKTEAQNDLVMAASFGREHMYHEDETVGLPDIMNDGHLKNGATYPTFGAVQPDTAMWPFSGSHWLTPSASYADLDPISERYQIFDGSHMPLPAQAPYLHTGQPEWTTQMAQESNAISGALWIPNTTFAGTKYYRVFAPSTPGFFIAQTRGVAWDWRIVDQAAFFTADSDPMSQYLHDFVSENALFMDTFATSGTTALEKSLGYFWNQVDSGGNNYQWWQDDFLFLAMGMTDWRGEYPHASAFLTNYYYKQVIGRADASVGGCLWAGPERVTWPFGTGFDITTLKSTWPDLFTNSTTIANSIGDPDWGSNPWTGCPGSGLAPDSAGTTPATPNGIASIFAVSPAMGSIIGVANSASMYSSIRSIQYGYVLPLSFIDFLVGGKHISEPTFAIGPLGAVN